MHRSAAQPRDIQSWKPADSNAHTRPVPPHPRARPHPSRLFKTSSIAVGAAAAALRLPGQRCPNVHLCFPEGWQSFPSPCLAQCRLPRDAPWVLQQCLTQTLRPLAPNPWPPTREDDSSKPPKNLGVTMGVLLGGHAATRAYKLHVSSLAARFAAFSFWQAKGGPTHMHAHPCMRGCCPGLGGAFGRQIEPVSNHGGSPAEISPSLLGPRHRPVAAFNDVAPRMATSPSFVLIDIIATNSMKQTD